MQKDINNNIKKGYYNIKNKI